LVSSVTSVIATRNRWEELAATLDRLTSLPERPPVLVVDNASSDGTPERVASAYPEVTAVALPANVGAAARTVGARLASTPFVAFNDDDSWWEPGALSLAADLLRQDPRIGLVAGHILVGNGREPDPTSELMAAGPLDEWLQPSPHGRRGVTGFLACAAVVRRSAFLAVGGFDQHLFIGGEEELVALDLADAGWKLVYEPRLIARHQPSPKRDTRHRQRVLARNHLLTGWMRLSAPAALRRSCTAWWSALGHDPRGWPGVAAALPDAGWALARRRVVAKAVEEAFTARG
jgi:GT2 family glycosyltransferase